MGWQSLGAWRLTTSLKYVLAIAIAIAIETGLTRTILFRPSRF
ncbi:hypothetical protein RISK_006817 [Rhodopirellula islandica]|uniref:Transmembrane protein n=1 Tax=Rhodopirellula islandica TaxID=595434 RepID=A0A0J1B3P9_RHOIS|nr:hypothetical protein RISK_006817 [Rhodopirellula islandica]